MPHRPFVSMLVACGAVAAMLSSYPAPVSAAESTPSVRLVAPCADGGTSIFALTSRKTSSGMAATATLSGATLREWYGGVAIGYYTRWTSGDPSSTYHLKDGRVRISKTSKKSWPRDALATLNSADASVYCFADVGVTKKVAEASSAQTQVLIRRDTGVVALQGSNMMNLKWRVNVRVWTPAGFQHRTRVVKVTDRGYDLTLSGFEKLGAFTKAVVTARSLNGKRTTYLRFSRTS